MDNFRQDLRYALRATVVAPIPSASVSSGGAPDVLGRTLEMAGVPCPTVGVTAEGFEYPTRLYTLGREPTALLRVADRNGLEVLSISLRTGRRFEATDRHGSVPVALVNEAAAQRFWPGEAPVGKRTNIGRRRRGDRPPALRCATSRSFDVCWRYARTSRGRRTCLHRAGKPRGEDSTRNGVARRLGVASARWEVRP